MTTTFDEERHAHLFTDTVKLMLKMNNITHQDCFADVMSKLLKDVDLTREQINDIFTVASTVTTYCLAADMSQARTTPLHGMCASFFNVCIGAVIVRPDESELN